MGEDVSWFWENLERVSFLGDVWVGDEPLMSRFPRLFH